MKYMKIKISQAIGSPMLYSNSHNIHSVNLLFASQNEISKKKKHVKAWQTVNNTEEEEVIVQYLFL